MFVPDHDDVAGRQDERPASMTVEQLLDDLRDPDVLSRAVLVIRNFSWESVQEEAGPKIAAVSRFHRSEPETPAVEVRFCIRYRLSANQTRNLAYEVESITEWDD